ncbi:MAG: hypothetical protein NVSMB9_07940 [Isosphaeraceae bacterium]
MQGRGTGTGEGPAQDEANGEKERLLKTGTSSRSGRHWRIPFNNFEASNASFAPVIPTDSPGIVPTLPRAVQSKTCFSRRA